MTNKLDEALGEVAEAISALKRTPVAQWDSKVDIAAYYKALTRRNKALSSLLTALQEAGGWTREEMRVTSDSADKAGKDLLEEVARS